MNIVIANHQADPESIFTVIFESYKLDKVLSVPNKNTAFNRRPYNNILIVRRWKNNNEEELKKARAYALQIAEVAAKGNQELSKAENIGYGNYGIEN